MSWIELDFELPCTGVVKRPDSVWRAEYNRYKEEQEHLRQKKREEKSRLAKEKWALLKTSKPHDDTLDKKRRKYRNLCWRLTNKIAHLVPDVHLRSWKGGHHVDHIVPISVGFKRDIPPELIASLDNLRMLPERDNLDKGTRLVEDALHLLDKWGY